MADPLALWTRDELRASFDEFCRRRDKLLREAAALLRSVSGWPGVNEALLEVSEVARERMRTILGLGADAE